MATGQSRATRRGRKKHVTADGKKLLWKMPGFQAFVPNAKPVPKKGRGRRKNIAHEPVTEPETGIHSKAWADAVVRQDSGFLRLPLELRMRIYEFAIRDFGIGHHAIEPRKKGMKFVCGQWPTSDEDTSRLYLICRQTYVDTVGRGVLYSQKLFFFASPNMMLNYLWVIHPVHLASISSIELHIKYTSSLNLNSLHFEHLAKCTGLKHLYILIEVPYEYCIPKPSSMTSTNWNTYTHTYTDRFWDKLTSWTTIRELKNLRDFRLAIHGRANGNEEAKKLIKEIGNGIRKAVVQECWQDKVVELDDRLKARYEGVPAWKAPVIGKGRRDDPIVVDM